MHLTSSPSSSSPSSEKSSNFVYSESNEDDIIDNLNYDTQIHLQSQHQSQFSSSISSISSTSTQPPHISYIFPYHFLFPSKKIPLALASHRPATTNDDDLDTLYSSSSKFSGSSSTVFKDLQNKFSKILTTSSKSQFQLPSSSSSSLSDYFDSIENYENNYDDIKTINNNNNNYYFNLYNTQNNNTTTTTTTTKISTNNNTNNNNNKSKYNNDNFTNNNKNNNRKNSMLETIGTSTILDEHNKNDNNEHQNKYVLLFFKYAQYNLLYIYHIS